MAINKLFLKLTMLYVWLHTIYGFIKKIKLEQPNILDVGVHQVHIDKNQFKNSNDFTIVGLNLWFKTKSRQTQNNYSQKFATLSSETKIQVINHLNCKKIEIDIFRIELNQESDATSLMIDSQLNSKNISTIFEPNEWQLLLVSIVKDNTRMCLYSSTTEQIQQVEISNNDLFSNSLKQSYQLTLQSLDTIEYKELEFSYSFQNIYIFSFQRQILNMEILNKECNELTQLQAISFIYFILSFNEIQMQKQNMKIQHYY